MRVVVLQDCDANADNRERRRALFLGQSYHLTDDEAEPLLAAGTVAVVDADQPTAEPAVRATSPPSSPATPVVGGEDGTAETTYSCPHNCGEGPWKTERGRTRHVDRQH